MHMTIERETIDFDVLFVGGGPASLAGAIRLMQLAAAANTELEVGLIEKGSEIGAHQISGAILDPRALCELIPDYGEKGFPSEGEIRDDQFWFLTSKKAFAIPHTPPPLHNAGNHVVSQSKLARWLGEMAEEMGVNVFPGFTGKEVLYDSQGGSTVIGVRTGDLGLGHDGSPNANFAPGIDIKAKVTIFGEGARGSLMKSMDEKLRLAGRLPQVYEVGVKEVIQLPGKNTFIKEGKPYHIMGYPLGIGTPGGGFIYPMAGNRVSLGYLVALCYEDPQMDPYEMFVHFKQHDLVANVIAGGKVLEQGARAVSIGGHYTLPRLSMDGALLVGGTAGFHNTLALKGIHLAMKSGMLAAEATFDALAEGRTDQDALERYETLVKNSWISTELMESRNAAAALAKKGPLKFLHLGAQQITQGRGLADPMDLESDHTTLSPKAMGKSAVGKGEPLEYDGTLYTDKLTGVYLSKTMHREDQPSHLVIGDLALCHEICYPTYGCPCTIFCPAKVYELEIDPHTDDPQMKLNPSNCLHCKTCDIKDPYKNINWTCPEGGEGPNYQMV
jgi:electron-transferring-flavoprotein dehydrogenase